MGISTIPCLVNNSTIFKEQLKNISTVLNNTGNTTQLLTSFNALDTAQQKVLLSSKLLTEEQKAQCLTMATLSSANTKYTAEQLTKATGISAETLATWGLTEATDTLTMSQLAEMASSDAQAKKVLEKIVAQNAQAVANGEVTASNIALASSEGGVTLATGAFTTAIKANISAMWTWMTTTPLGWLTLLVAGVFAAVKAYDALTVSVEEQKEKMEESLSAYEDAKSELSGITTELENQEQAMGELLAKEKLTYAEKGQLEELQAITQELRIQKDLAEKEEGRTKKEVATDTSDLFKKQFGKYDISESAINEYQNNADITGNNAILISDENDISAMIAGYKQFNELLDEAYGEGNQENIDHFKSLTDDLKDSIFATAQDLQEQQSNISDYYNTIKDVPYEELTSDQKEIVDSYNAISNAIALIYKQLDPNTWNEMQIDNLFATEGVEKTKEELVEMAKEGTLDEKTIQSYSKLNSTLENSNIVLEDGQSAASALCDEMYALADAEDKVKSETFNNETDILPFSDIIKQLDDMKSKMDVLDKTYAKLFDGDKDTNIGIEDYSSILDTFKDIEGLDISDFVQQLQEAGQDTEKVNAVMSDLIATYLDCSGVMENVTEENATLIEQTLTEMGIENAHEIVMAQLSEQTEILALQKQFLTEKGYELCDATVEEINQFLDMSDASDIAKQSIAQLALETIDFSNINLNEDANIEQLIALANTAGASATAIAKAHNALNFMSDVKNGSKVLNGSAGDFRMLESASQTTTAINNGTYNWEYEKLDANDFKVTNSSKYKPKYSGGSSTKSAANKAASDAASSAKKEFEELFDFFERRVKVLDNALSLLKTNLENVTGSFAKNQLLSAEQNLNAEKINNYTDALAMYTQKVNEALSKLPTDIAQKIQNGAVDLTTFVGDGNKDVVEAIKDYQSWVDKIADCKQELAELKEEIRQLELEKFNNIIQDFTDQFNIRDDANTLIDKQIALLQEAGQMIGESFYTAQIDQSKKQLAILEEEKAKLVEQMTSALSSGRVNIGDESWLSMVKSLQDVDGSILDCKKSIEEFDNALLELHTEVFNRIQEQFSNLNSELENLGGLFDDFDVADENGNWTKEGLTQLGLLTQQYELAEYQIQQYNDEIAELNKQYLAGRYSATEYADKLAELSSAQWDAVNASEAVKDAIIDLNEARIDEEINGIEKEIDAYKELIDAQIDALQAAKDLHDYEESIAEKTKSITDLERQIAAMQNDNTAATVAKRKKLEEQLAEAKKDLEEAQYDHSIETQEDALNKEYDRFEQEKNDEIEALKASLEERELLIAQSFESVKANADIVGQEINYIAQQHGISVSNSITNAWRSGENAIASYGNVLSSSTSAFIGNLMAVENEVWSLQAQANNTANSLAWMFSTRADTLVNELTSSYYAESNLNAMTNALQDSLVNTLERGYNISGITSALNGIANAANGVASAANNAASALANMGAVKDTIPTTNSNKNQNEFYYVDKNGKKSYVGHTGYTPKNGMMISKYASGTRRAKGGLSITDEEGYELKLPKLANGNYTITGEGDQILTKAQTDNIFDWSKFNPDDLIKVDVPSISSIVPTMPDIVSRNIGNNVTLHYDSLVTVNGDVNDTNHFLKQIEGVAGNVINKSFTQLNKQLKLGGS